MILDQDTIKKFAWHLKVMGAYVQQPTPAIVGLDENTIISSNDAAALYPTSIIYSNIGFDTIRHRIYEPQIIGKILMLIEQTFVSKKTNPAAVSAAVAAFKSALEHFIKNYFKTKTVQNKKDALEFTIEYYPLLLERVLNYGGDLQDIYEPKTDEEYYLLKSCLHPILETISWLSPSNKGYNRILVDYVFFNDEYTLSPKETYVMMDINSTKTQLKKLTPQDSISLFQKYIINPYGILFDKHEDNLAYDVELLMEALARRRVVKNQMLVLESIVGHWDKLSQGTIEYLYSFKDGFYINEEYSEKILTEIKDTQDRVGRIKSLTEVKWDFQRMGIEPKAYAQLRMQQFKIVQEGIKVAANSAYGIFGLITWPFASPLIGNAITNAGKIYGIKLFQAVTVDVLNLKEKENEQLTRVS